jgi:NTP pyrophosphatase (non-canonical NTP hydrolase)
MNLQTDLQDAQMRLLSIFEKNNRQLTVWMLGMYLVARTTSLLATIQKRKFSIARVQIVQIFGWLAAIANHPQVNVCLSKNLRSHFPGICPACGQGVCVCSSNRLPERVSLEDLKLMEGFMPKINLQGMLKCIFPDNTLDISTAHLIADVGELGQEIVRASLRNQKYPRYGANPEFLLELADVTAHLCAVSSLLEQDLAVEVMHYFRGGCVVCKLQECDCRMVNVQLEKVGSRPLGDEES